MNATWLFFFFLQAFSAPLDFIGRRSWWSVTSVKSDIPHPSEEHSVIYLKLSSTDVWVQSISLLALWCQIQPENNCDYKGKERSGLAPQLCLSAWVKCMQSCNYNWTAYAIAVHTTQSDMQTYTGWLKMWHSGLSIGGKKKRDSLLTLARLETSKNAMAKIACSEATSIYFLLYKQTKQQQKLIGRDNM